MEEFGGQPLNGQSIRHGQYGTARGRACSKAGRMLCTRVRVPNTSTLVFGRQGARSLMISSKVGGTCAGMLHRPRAQIENRPTKDCLTWTRQPLQQPILKQHLHQALGVAA